MRVLRLLILFALMLNINSAFAQAEFGEKNPRILILMDGSSSMIKEWNKQNTRFEAAAKIVDKLMDSVYSVNKDVEFALRVYGHQHPTSENNCYDTKLEVKFSRDNYTQMMLRMAALHTLGVSPIAYSLQQAAENDMTNLRENKYSLILITDGGESCEGDICKVVEELLKKKIDFKPYILSLVDYAPLKSQYACLGDYLLVTGPDDVDPVVGKIVESYRKSFIMPTATRKLMETVKAAPPSALKINIPITEIKTTIPDDPEPEPVVKAEPTKPAPIPIPVPTKPSNIKVQDARTPRAKETSTTLTTATNAPVGEVKKPVIIEQNNPKFEAPEPPRITEPVYTPLPTTPIAKTTETSKKVLEQKPITYTITREETGETSLQLYLTNGKGKYYESAPKVNLVDPRTGEVKYSFDRNVDAYGEPRPQKDIAPGVYDLTFPGKSGFMAPNIEVRASEKNRMDIVVSNGSLAFTYNNNPDRPVKEFAARVNVFLGHRNVTKQFCTEILEYEPGNYHIEINTNPISVRNVDLEFNAVVYLGIDEPGKVKVYNPKVYRSIQFYYQLGDSYKRFTPMDVKGDINQQEFLIQPGRYKIAYEQNPNSRCTYPTNIDCRNSR